MPPLRMGILGMGYAGRQHLAATAELAGVTVTAVADPHMSDGLPTEIDQFDDWRDLIHRAPVDAVSICLPHHLHQATANAALDAGKHVLMEKPLACSIDEAQAIVRLAEQCGKTLMVGLTHRFYAPVVAARAQIEAGSIGTLLAVEDRIMEDVPAGFSGWLTTEELAGGGVALTNGVHMLDRIAFVTGQRLTFDAGHAGRQLQLGDVEDTAAMMLHLDDGVPVQFLAQWRAGPNQNVDDELTLYGTTATLRVKAWRGWRLEPVDGPAQQVQSYAEQMTVPEVARQAMGEMIGEFGEAVAGHERHHPTVAGALDAQRLIDAFYKTAGGTA